jgi:mannitol/fructose-specific phosphotransferase system IIA component (Ntr-type)
LIQAKPGGALPVGWGEGTMNPLRTQDAINAGSLPELQPMRLSEMLKPQNIKLALEAKAKADAISELVNLLAANGEIGDPKKVLDSVLEREATRTTGIGNGLAIPHGKCPGTDHLVMALGKATAPIDFQAIDGRPVTWIWLLSSPPDKTGPHIHALARISRLMTIDKFRAGLAQAKTAQEVFDIIQQQENAL